MTEYVAQSPAPLVNASPIAHIEINSGTTVYHEAGTTWEDPGALWQGQDLTGSGGTITGTVDENTLGTYTLTYTHPNATEPVYRTVIVQDTTPPVPSGLPGSVDRTFTYEEGSLFALLPTSPTATDSFEGDVTARLVQSGDTLDINTAGTYNLIYDCDDTSGNAMRTVRITYVVTGTTDTTPPDITIPDSMTWTVGETLTAQAAFDALNPTANDDHDGPLTLTASNITFGVVNTTVEDTYSNAVICTVSDSSANEAVAYADVIVQSAAESAIQTFTVQKSVADGSDETTPYITKRFSFAEGDFPANKTIEVRKTGEVTGKTTQISARSTQHSDGSVNQATVMFQADTLTDANTVEYGLWLISGSDSTSFRSGQSESDSFDVIRNNSEFNVDVDIDGPIWTASLEYAFDSGIKRELRAGPLCRKWMVWAPFRNGGADHVSLWCRWYVTLWGSSGTTIQVWPQVINGYVAGCSNVTYDLTFRNGASPGGDIDLGGTWTSLTQQWHTIVNVLDEDALPYWLSNKPAVFVAIDPDYAQTTKTYLPYDSNIDMTAASGGDTRIFRPARILPYKNRISDGGGRWELGDPLSETSSKALLGQKVDYDREDRVRSLIFCSCPIYHAEPITGEVPVHDGNDYSSDGLGSVDRSGYSLYYDNLSTNVGAPVTDPEYSPPAAWIGWTDIAHAPEPFAYQWMQSGEEAFADLYAMQGAWFLGALNTLYRDKTSTIGGRSYYPTTMWQSIIQVRGHSRAVRTWSGLAWCLADDHPAVNYFSYLCTEAFAFMYQVMTTPRASIAAGQPRLHDESTGLGIWSPPGEYGDSSSLGTQQQNWLGFQFVLGYLRGQTTSDWVQNVSEKFVGRANSNGSPVGSAFQGLHAYHIQYKEPPYSAGTGTYFSTWSACQGDASPSASPDLHGSLVPANEPGSGLRSEDDTAWPRWSTYVWPASIATSGHSLAELTQWVGALEGFGTPNADFVVTYMRNEDTQLTDAQKADNPKYRFRNPLG